MGVSYCGGLDGCKGIAKPEMEDTSNRQIRSSSSIEVDGGGDGASIPSPVLRVA